MAFLLIELGEICCNTWEIGPSAAGTLLQFLPKETRAVS